MTFINGETNYDEWRDHSKDNKKYLARMEVINAMKAKETLTLADEILLVAQIVISCLTGKLEDFWAISTSVLMNYICQCRAKIENCICKSCYAAKGAAGRSALTQVLETNYIILNTWLISLEAWATLAFPTINGKGRIESHGDLASVTCARNYLRIIKSHPHITFGFWTKNAGFIYQAIIAEGKPENCKLVLSSPIVNQVMEVPEKLKPYVDHVFTVFTEDYAKERNININCGSWSGSELDHRCNKCFRCYEDNTEFYINELKK